MTAAERADLASLAAELGALVRFDAPLAELTTWRIGGPATALAQPTTRAATLALVDWTRRHGWPLRVLGNGSNLLVPDAGVEGLVLHLANQLADACFDGSTLVAEAGCFLPKLARAAGELGLSGLECVVGVPGTVGGGCVTNAGIPSGTLGDCLVSLDALDAAGDVRALARDELALGHRDSRLRHEPWVVLSAKFALTPGDSGAILERMRAHLEYRRRTQPLNQPTCGSVFRRPPGGYPGELLERAGCKGLRVGQAVVSDLHANWIVNLGGARAADVRALMDELRTRVQTVCGVELVAEVEVW